MARKITNEVRMREKRKEMAARQRPKAALSAWKGWPLLAIIMVLILWELHTFLEVDVFAGMWLGVVAAVLTMPAYVASFWMGAVNWQRFCERLGGNVRLILPLLLTACVGMGVIRLEMCVEDVSAKDMVLPVIGHESRRISSKGGKDYYLKVSRKSLGHDDSIYIQIDPDAYERYQKNGVWPENVHLEYHENGLLVWGKLLQTD